MTFSIEKTLFLNWDHAEPFETALIWTFDPLVAIDIHCMEKDPGMFSSNVVSFRLKKDMEETTVGLALFSFAILGPAGWVLANLENYKKRDSAASE